MKTTILAVLGLLLILVLKLEVEAGCETNGCSIPGNLPFPYKRYFIRACNKHDVCYACGKNYGWNRLECDNGFYQDMAKVCNEKFFLFKDRCFRYAGIYYGAVRLGGKQHYEDPSLDWCDTCPSSNGDPYKRVPLFGRR